MCVINFTSEEKVQCTRLIMNVSQLKKKYTLTITVVMYLSDKIETILDMRKKKPED